MLCVLGKGPWKQILKRLSQRKFSQFSVYKNTAYIYNYYHLPNPRMQNTYSHDMYLWKKCQDVGESKDTNHGEGIPNDESSMYGVALPTLPPKNNKKEESEVS